MTARTGLAKSGGGLPGGAGLSDESGRLVCVLFSCIMFCLPVALRHMMQLRVLLEGGVKRAAGIYQLCSPRGADKQLAGERCALCVWCVFPLLPAAFGESTPSTMSTSFVQAEKLRPTAFEVEYFDQYDFYSLTDRYSSKCAGQR